MIGFNKITLFMKFSKFFSRQAMHPTGVFGRFFMSRFFEHGNARLNRFVFYTLDVGEGDRVLEIGFGPGAMMKRIADQLVGGTIQGIDLSRSMVSAAEKKNRKHINRGKVTIRHGDFESAEFEQNFFDIVFSVNTVYFWKDPQTTISKIARFLKHGGKVVIGFHAREDMENSSLDRDVFRLYSSQEMIDLLTASGSFRQVSVVSKPNGNAPHYCAVGIK